MQIEWKSYKGLKQQLLGVLQFQITPSRVWSCWGNSAALCRYRYPVLTVCKGQPTELSSLCKMMSNGSWKATPSSSGHLCRDLAQPEYFTENIWHCLLIGCFREQRQGAETAPPLICVKLWSSSQALSSWITSIWSCRKGCFSNFGMDLGKEVSMGWNFHLVRTLPWSPGYLLSFAVLKEQLTRHRCQLVAFVGIRHR